MSNELPPLPEPTVMLPAFVDGIGEYEEPMFDSMSMREYGRACQQADDELLRQAGFAFRSVWAIGLTSENVYLIEAAMLAIEARLGADK